MSKHMKTNEDFILLSKNIHGESAFSYENCDYIGDYEPVVITCSKHSDFIIKNANQHIHQKQGCHACNKFKNLNKKLEIKYKDYCYIFSDELYTNERYSKDMVVVTCLKHEVCFLLEPNKIMIKRELCLCDLCKKEKKMNSI